MDLSKKIDALKKRIEEELRSTSDLDEVYLKYFSRNVGLGTALIKEVPKLSKEEKAEVGPHVVSLLEYKAKIEEEKAKRKNSELLGAELDLSLPLPPKQSGYLHPTTQVIRELNKFFRYHGFSVYEGPEIETDEYNFRRLNLPEDHPATDQQDSLFIKAPSVLLRTHTSSVEARALETLKPPIRIVTPGKVYRNETLNRTNSSFFYQYQGVVVDKGITMKQLKATLELVHKFLFGNDVVLRYRYKYYPEVSPGLGVDMQCKFCHGAGCDVCKGRGWLEMLGSGMIHYNTLKMSGIDPEEYTGFAFGMGLDRQVIQKFGVDDIRKLYSGELVYT